ncbi:molybdenum ABC transporter ATP-binding protein [Shimia aestuarii]|uniref:Molybdate transport system ATP-binding protein n=1 Tax=Shimia aestuarii TaxID=254406 RepID=A0A1I4SUA9_9RHOB|nr:molybdenum ABC transporter ATP-binding protein [Shimia aestuarii]SFM68118.1 molybdate transport system ATP-binding protein [Shimia aestuarii]
MSLFVKVKQKVEGFDLDVDFEAPTGATVLFGASGSGKTTLINAVAGLSRGSVGRVAVDDWVLQDSAAGIWLPPHKRRLGYVFQEGRLFPHMSVKQNLAYGQRFAPKDGAVSELDKVVHMLGIEPLLGRRPGMLSGGEKQRVAIGRALLARPRLILADEPLAALDEARKAEIMPYFERLRDEADVPILYVSHSMGEVARLATTVVALERGRVSRVGPAAEVLGDPGFTPAGVRAVGAVLEARVVAHHEDGLSELDAGGNPLFLPRISQRIGTLMRVRIAAHDVILSREEPKGLSALNMMAGEIDAVRAGDGPGAIVSVKTNAGPVLARVTRRSADALGLVPGVKCYAVVKTVSIAPEDVGGR